MQGSFKVLDGFNVGRETVVKVTELISFLCTEDPWRRAFCLRLHDQTVVVVRWERRGQFALDTHPTSGLLAIHKWRPEMDYTPPHPPETVSHNDITQLPERLAFGELRRLMPVSRCLIGIHVYLQNQ